MALLWTSAHFKALSLAELFFSFAILFLSIKKAICARARIFHSALPVLSSLQNCQALDVCSLQMRTGGKNFGWEGFVSAAEPGQWDVCCFMSCGWISLSV